MAYKLLIDDLAVKEEVRRDCLTVEAVVFWAPFTPANNVVMMGLSKSLNHCEQTRMEDGQFLTIVRQMRRVWIRWGRPQSDTAHSRDSKWGVNYHCRPRVLCLYISVVDRVLKCKLSKIEYP